MLCEILLSLSLIVVLPVFKFHLNKKDCNSKMQSILEFSQK